MEQSAHQMEGTNRAYVPKHLQTKMPTITTQLQCSLDCWKFMTIPNLETRPLSTLFFQIKLTSTH